MVTGIEGVGEAVTGGMVARAVEPASGEAAEDGHTHERACLNCGTLLAGPYCHACGQKAHIHRTLSAFFHDLLHGVLHVEGKIFRTLPMLALRPGELTRRYIDGERARFVSPMALFLFSVFTMFAVFQLIGGPFTSEIPAPATNEMRTEWQRGIDRHREDEARLVRRREAQLRRGQSTAEIDRRLADIRQDISALEVMSRVVPADGQAGPGDGAPSADPQTNAAQPAAEAEKAAPAPDGQSGAPVRVRGPPNLVLNENNVNTGWPKLDRAILKASDNPTLFLYKVQTNAYKFSWALIPISVPFVWLMFFWRRRFKVYDHTVFVTYSLAFMTLMVVLLSLLLPIFRTDALAGFALVFITPIHMYKQLKYTYGLTRFRALVRTFALLIFAIIAATLFFMLLLTLGALG